MERIFQWAVGVLTIWLLAWIYVSWPYSLDDALIHLRYADHLLHQHRITYDGVNASFGTSSLLYVSLLAGLRAAWTSPLLPRVVSSLVYLAFFVLLAHSLRRMLRQYRAPASVWLMSLALLAVFVAPSAVRWMDDGMETGLVFLDALVAILLTWKVLHAPRLTGRLFASSFFLGFCSVLLRVELLALIGCISLIVALELFAGKHRRHAVEHRGLATGVAAMPLAGGLVAAALIIVTMHALLPDTALAKAFGAGAWQDTFEMTAVTVASSFSFGIGLLLLWMMSLTALLLCTTARFSDVPGNVLFPLVLLVSATRGQQIQGIRYFGWTLFFPLLWNVYRLCSDGHMRFRATEVVFRLASAALLVVLVPSFAWESVTFRQLFRDRGAALNAFRSQNLSGLKGQLGIAEDVGFVGYFTQARICDPYGLVNGRAAARLKYAQRFDNCMAEHPVFAFGSEDFLRKVDHVESLRDWLLCGTYTFSNVRSRDVHYLVVDPAVARAACLGNAAPLRIALPASNSRQLTGDLRRLHVSKG